MILTLVGAVICIVVIVSAVWSLIKWLRPTVTATAVGKSVETGVDRMQDWSALAMIRTMRLTDEVNTDPMAIAACDYLAAKFRATGPIVVTPTVAPVVAKPSTVAANADEVVFKVQE